jgi:hypothetical protein
MAFPLGHTRQYTYKRLAVLPKGVPRLAIEVHQMYDQTSPVPDLQLFIGLSSAAKQSVEL